MTSDVTVLGLAVDSRQVTSAAQALDQMASAGKNAESATQAVEAAAKRSAGAAQAVAGAYGKAAASTGAAATAGRLADDAIKRVGASSASAAKHIQMSAYQTAQLNFQLHDFAVQVASGGNPLLALVQQGSQLSGTFGGVGGAMRAVMTVFTPFRVMVGGAAGVVLALGAAALKGADESVALSRSLLLTGNAAGITRSEFERLKVSIADAAGTTVGSSRELLQSLVSTGRFSGEALTATATAAQLLGKATGQSTEDILKSFISLADGVGAGAERLNRTYHFLSAEQLKYIKTLEDQGQHQKAIKLTMDALSERVGVAAREVGFLEQAWNAAKKAVSGYVDAALNVGRKASTQDALDRISQELAARQARGPLNELTRKSFEKGNDALRQQQAILQEVLRMEGRSAEIGAKSAATEQAKISFMKLQEQSLTKQQQLQKELDKANALADAAGATEAERAAVLASIREKFSPGLDKAGLGAKVSEIRSELESLTAAYAASEAILEAQRSAGIISERSYFDAKRAFIRLEEDAQIRALERENAALAKAKSNATERVENERRIAENRAKIESLRAGAAAKIVVTDAQQEAGLRKVASGYEQARLAADAYLTTLQRQQQQELNGIGLGGRIRDRLAARGQIEDRFQAQREELDAQRRIQEIEGRFGEVEEQQYRKRLALIDEFQTKALASWDEFYAKRTAAEGNFNAGASEAIANYAADSANVAKHVEHAFTNAFQSMEDALVRFIRTGKLDFKSLAESIIADLIRIEVKARIAAAAATFQSGGGLGDVLKAFLSMSASGGPTTGDFARMDRGQIPGRAGGGPVKAGRIYEVNENRKGPGELLNVAGRQFLLAGRDGMVTPNNGAGAMSFNPTTYINIDSRTDAAQIMQLVVDGVREGQIQTFEALRAMGRI